MKPASITLDDLSRAELIDLVKRSGLRCSQRTFLSIKWSAAGRRVEALSERLIGMIRAEQSAFDAYMSASADRQRAELHLKWIDAKDARAAADRNYDAAKRIEDRLWSALSAADLEDTDV
jgi:hypothetical protein